MWKLPTMALPLASSNIEGFAYIIHEMAINVPGLSGVLANLSDAMLRKLPPEISRKTRSLLMERCKNLFMCPNIDPDTRAKNTEL
jgi:hypothetical protein